MREIEPSQEQAERFVSDRGGVFIRVPVPVEAAFFQALGTDPKAGPIRDEQFDAVANAIAKNEDMPTERIFFQLMGDDPVESIEALAHVGDTGDDKDPGGGTQRDHDGVSRWW